MVQQMNWGYINFSCRINALSKYGQHENNYSGRYWKFFLFECCSSVVRMFFDASSTLVRRLFE